MTANTTHPTQTAQLDADQRGLPHGSSPNSDLHDALNPL